MHVQLYIALSDDMHVLDYKCDRIPGRSMCKEEDRVWLLNHYDSYQERAGRREDLIEKLEADCPVPGESTKLDSSGSLDCVL